MRCIGLLPGSPERLSGITCGALAWQLRGEQLPCQRDWTATGLLRATIATMLYGAIRSVYPGIYEEQLRVVISPAMAGRRWTHD